MCPAGAQSELSGDAAQRAARSGDGRHHGGLLPGLLAAVRRGRSARHLRPQRPPDAGGQHHAVAAGQVFHCGQPFYLHIHEQTGETLTLSAIWSPNYGVH